MTELQVLLTDPTGCIKLGGRTGWVSVWVSGRTPTHNPVMLLVTLRVPASILEDPLQFIGTRDEWNIMDGNSQSLAVTCERTLLLKRLYQPGR